VVGALARVHLQQTQSTRHSEQSARKHGRQWRGCVHCVSRGWARATWRAATRWATTCDRRRRFASRRCAGAAHTGVRVRLRLRAGGRVRGGLAVVRGGCVVWNGSSRVVCVRACVRACLLRPHVSALAWCWRGVTLAICLSSARAGDVQLQALETQLIEGTCGIRCASVSRRSLRCPHRQADHSTARGKRHTASVESEC
jgi:hypothetical protein